MEDRLKEMLCQQGKQICKEPCNHHDADYQKEMALDAFIEKEEERFRNEYCDECEETVCICGQ